MLVKDDGKTLSFLFQGSDIFFEMGCKLLEQEKLPQQLAYKRRRQNGREKIVYLLNGQHIVPLKSLEGTLGSDRAFNLIYELFLLIVRVEENGFLKRECIWCRYDNLYYDICARHMKIALLPVAGTVRQADKRSWHECLEQTVLRLAAELVQEQAVRIGQLARLLTTNAVTVEEVLSELDCIGSGRSQRTADMQRSEAKRSLKLYYGGNNARLEFLVDDRDFVIGRSKEWADGIVDETVSTAVSRRHCFITRLGNKFFVQDLKSVNHTFVNGIMIPPYEFMELENHDVLSVADVDFRITLLDLE